MRSALTTLGVVGPCVNDLELALSEACTNVLRHASGIPDEYQVETHIEKARATITVTDSGGGFEPRARPTRGAPLNAEGGRGIQLMRALVDDLSFLSDERGTRVELTKALTLASTSALGPRNAARGPARRRHPRRRSEG